MDHNILLERLENVPEIGSFKSYFSDRFNFFHVKHRCKSPVFKDLFPETFIHVFVSKNLNKICFKCMFNCWEVILRRGNAMQHFTCNSLTWL